MPDGFGYNLVRTMTLTVVITQTTVKLSFEGIDEARVFYVHVAPSRPSAPCLEFVRLFACGAAGGNHVRRRAAMTAVQIQIN